MEGNERASCWLARIRLALSLVPRGYLAASALAVWRGCIRGSYSVSLKLVQLPLIVFSKAKGGGTGPPCPPPVSALAHVISYTMQLHGYFAATTKLSRTAQNACLFCSPTCLTLVLHNCTLLPEISPLPLKNSSEVSWTGEGF